MTQGYRRSLRELQIGLVRYQAWAMKEGVKDLVVFEGRDGAGKDGTIKRVVEHLAPRATRVVALPKPSDRQKSEWWFQRYVGYLPAAGEIVIFNRSWYNRAGVERVMGFCTEGEAEEFLRDAPVFERMLAESGVRIVKLWLDISRREQARRLADRRDDPVKTLKVSALDAEAQKRWSAYSKARDEMLLRTSEIFAPWVCVAADRKKPARLAVIRHLLAVLAPAEIAVDYEPPDAQVLFRFEPGVFAQGRLAK